MFLSLPSGAESTNCPNRIDLPTALRLAGAQNLDVKIARAKRLLGLGPTARERVGEILQLGNCSYPAAATFQLKSFAIPRCCVAA